MESNKKTECLLFCTLTSEAIGKGVNQVLNFCFDFPLLTKQYLLDFCSALLCLAFIIPQEDAIFICIGQGCRNKKESITDTFQLYENRIYLLENEVN